MPRRRKSDEVIVRLDENVKTVLKRMDEFRECQDRHEIRLSSLEGSSGIMKDNIKTNKDEIGMLRKSQGAWSIINSLAAAVGIYLGASKGG